MIAEFKGDKKLTKMRISFTPLGDLVEGPSGVTGQISFGRLEEELHKSGELKPHEKIKAWTVIYEANRLPILQYFLEPS